MSVVYEEDGESVIGLFVFLGLVIQSPLRGLDFFIKGGSVVSLLDPPFSIMTQPVDPESIVIKVFFSLDPESGLSSA